MICVVAAAYLFVVLLLSYLDANAATDPNGAVGNQGGYSNPNRQESRLDR